MPYLSDGWVLSHSVADEDIPETARLPPKGSDEEETPKKPKAAAKKAKAEPQDDAEDVKPKKAAKPAGKPNVSCQAI